MAVLLLTVFAWHSTQPKFVPMTAALFVWAACLPSVIGEPLVASPPWHMVQVEVAPHCASAPVKAPVRPWQLMLEQLFVPLVQVNALPLPATGLMLPLTWSVPVMLVPVEVVMAWQLPHAVAAVTCLELWLFARAAPAP